MEIAMKQKISGGIYLVIDPSMDKVLLKERLEKALIAKVSVVQIWDNWSSGLQVEESILEICDLCHRYQVPVLINNDWQLLKSLPLDGVHFDEIPEQYDQIKAEIDKEFLSGITCNNDLSLIQWADENQLDYVSFCSIFPSSTSNSCELVSFDTIQQARKRTTLPIFLAGGIRLDTMPALQTLDYDGVAIISGIMSAEKPDEVTQQYVELLNHKHETRNHL
jgi:thiamine-phosphate pyrophosphorylase